MEVVPGLDVVADAGAGYLDKEAVSADIAEFAAADAEDSEAAIGADEDAAEDSDASCTNSFRSTTLVLMADGTSKPIDQVHVGDRVENAKPGTKRGSKDEQHKVTAVHVTYDDRAYPDVTVSTGRGTATITGTAYHLYWDATTRKWTQARQLRIGDHLQSTNGGQTGITALHSYTTTMVTYNLTIDTVHTYYVRVGPSSVLVHNEDGCGSSGSISMDRAVELGADHVGGEGQMGISGSGGYQFIRSSLDESGNTVTKIARFDVNQASRHVQTEGPHLNLETQINGRTVRTGPLADPHLSIDPVTIRPGDIP